MSDYRIQSIDRAFQLLNIISSSNKPLSLDEIANRSNLNRNTVFKLLASLCHWGVLHSERHKGYTLGLGIMRYYDALKRSFPLVSIVENHMSQLRDITGETAGLFIQQNFERQCIDVKESNQVVRRVLQVGTTGPLYLGAVGKVFLAYMTEKERDEVLAGMDEVSYVSGEVIPKKDFYLRLDQIRNNGYAIGIQEGLIDTWAVAAPIFDREGQVIAGIATSGPISRSEPDHIESCAAETKRTCEVISQIIQES